MKPVFPLRLTSETGQGDSAGLVVVFVGIVRESFFFIRDGAFFVPSHLDNDRQLQVIYIIWYTATIYYTHVYVF